MTTPRSAAPAVAPSQGDERAEERRMVDETEPARDVVGEIGADHEDVTVGEVNQLQDAEDHPCSRRR